MALLPTSHDAITEYQMLPPKRIFKTAKFKKKVASFERNDLPKRKAEVLTLCQVCTDGPYSEL